MVNRLDFLKTGPFSPPDCRCLSELCMPRNKDVDRAQERLDPGINLVHDGINYAQKGKKNNRPPVLREEIL